MDILDNNKISTQDGRIGFRFYDCKRHYSFKRASIPALEGENNCVIETEIVKADIPLLLSKTSLKRAHAVIDLDKYVITMFGKSVELETTSSGHYCISICPNPLILVKLVKIHSSQQQWITVKK